MLQVQEKPRGVRIIKTFRAENYIKGGLSLGIFSSTVTRSAEPLHSHDFTEIVYVRSGEGVEVIDGREYTARRGDLFFINYGSTHRFYTEGEFSYYNVCFDPEIIARRIISRENAFELLSLTAIDELRGSDTAIGRIHFGREERPLIEALLSDMLSEYGTDMSERSAVLESYMTVRVAKILRKTRPVSNKSELDRTWDELSDFIGDNLGRRLSLSELAKKCFYNPSYFSRAFKERYGISLSEYLSRERASAAAELLCDTELSVDEIAARCGFGDKSGLYRAFQRHYGMSAGEYRQKNR